MGKSFCNVCCYAIETQFLAHVVGEVVNNELTKEGDILWVTFFTSLYRAIENNLLTPPTPHFTREKVIHMGVKWQMSLNFYLQNLDNVKWKCIVNEILGTIFTFAAYGKD